MTEDEATPPVESLQLKPYPVDELHFDPQNPRLPEGVDGTDDGAVVRWMLEDATLLDLMGSIAEHGFFAGEPLLLAPRPEGGYVVVEGNRRLAAVRLLLHPEQAPVRRETVSELSAQARQRPSELTGVLFPHRDAIVDYLGFRHITGVKEWDPLAKARYLRQLWDRVDGDSAEKLRVLARKIGSQPYYVSRLLGGLRVFDTIESEGFFGIDGLNDRTLSFSLLSTALSYNSLAEYMGVAPDPAVADPVDRPHVEKVARWMFEPLEPDGRTVLGESRNLQALAAVVARPEARSLLEDGATLTDAALATEHPAQMLTRALRQARDRLDAAQKIMRRVDETTDAHRTLLEEIVEAAQDLLAGVNRRARRRDERA